MQKRKGFTLIELMVVVLIVGILAAVAVPVMRGRVDAAKWSEGKSGAGSIATALRAYAAEKGVEGTYPPSLTALGFKDSDLNGTYFTIANYTIEAAEFTEDADPELTFTIQVSNEDLNPGTITLDQDGVWTEE